ncbi:NADH dehydrogenase (ubiquinone) B15 subunit [Oratosquilla oratoria]|uniref:NADH dehydrogenase (ubiquinone) B15 subunit n=1 Tax=Oratosquilla oratoria TaxID=337810 RepID=UPI003F759275
MAPATDAEIEAARLRLTRRNQLKLDFLRQATNPHTHAAGQAGHVVDPAIQRFLAMRSTQVEHFRATPRTSMLGFLLIALPIGAYGYLLKRDKENQEDMYRTGQVAYKDRPYKFV